MISTILPALITLLNPSGAHAADVPQSFTLDGRLYSDAAGTTPLLDGAIGFTIQILDEDKVCILYEEAQVVSTLASTGYFTAQVGTVVGSPLRGAGDSANSMPAIFQNMAPVSGKFLSNGAPCTAAAAGGKRRFVRIKIAPPTMGGGARTLSPDLTIDSVPNAIVAERAESLQGLRATNVLQVNTASGSELSQTNLESLFTSTARFNSLTAVVDGTSANYMRSNSTSGANLPVMAGAPTAPVPGAVWYDSSDSKLKFQTSVGPVIVGTGVGSVTSVGFTAPSELAVTGAPVTASGTIAVTWATQTANKVFAAPDGVAGTPTFRVLTSGDIPSLPWTKITSLLPTTLLGYGITDAVKNAGGTPSLESGLNAAKGAAATAGRVWISTDTKEIYRDNGATWDLIGSGSAASGTVTSVSSANAYLSVATATTTPALTLNVGVAANTVAAGDDSRITGALAAATAFTGDVSGVYSATSVDKIKGTGVAITALGTGHFFRYNGTNWVNTSLVLADVTTGLGYTPVNKAGDTMTGLLVLSADPSDVLGATTKQYVDSSTSTAAANYLKKDATVALTADWDVDGAGAGTRKIAGLADPTASDGATTKNYSDTQFITKALPAAPALGQNGQSLRWNNTTPAWEFYSPSTGTGDFLANGTIPMTGTLKMGGQSVFGNSTANGNLILESTSDATKGYVLLAPNGGGVGIGTAAPTSALDLTGAFTVNEMAAPAVSAADTGRIYFDSTSNTFKVSQHGGAYIDLIGGGTVTSVSSANAYLSVATATTTPALTLNVGVAANTVAAGDDSRITGALAAATAFTGDVSGVYSATSVDKIKGTAVSITALGTGHFLRYNGTNWVNTSLVLADVTTGLGYTPVNKAGDTMTGLLVLSADPSDVLGATTKQYVDSSTSTAAANYLKKDATVALTADWDADGAGAGTRKITGLTDPTASDGAVTKNYSDTQFITKALPAAPALGQNGQSLRWNNTTPAWEFYTPTTGGGVSGLTSGRLPKAASATSLSDSIIYESSGSIGVGWSVPANPQVLNVSASTATSAASVTSYPFSVLQNATANKRLLLGVDDSNGVGLIQSVNIGTGWLSTSINPNGGNVGIGTTSPTGGKLDISAGTQTSSLPIINGTETWNSVGTTFTATKINVTDTASAATSLLMDLQVGGVSKFSVDKTGKVSGDGSGLTGISASSLPLSSLTSAAAANTQDNANYAQTWTWNTLTTGTAMNMSTTSMTSGSMLALSTNYNSATATGSLLNLSVSGTNNAVTPIKITQNASTFIPAIKINSGNGAMIELLTSNSASYTSLNFRDYNDSAAGWVGYGNPSAAVQTNQVYMESAGTRDIAFWTNDTQKMVIQGSTGHVGVGTINPTEKLQVTTGANPSVNFTTTGISLGTTAGTWTSRLINGAFQTYDLDIDINASGSTNQDIRFLTPNAGTTTEKMRIKNSGNVGIGTTNPGQRLEVNGSVLATGYLYSSDRRLKTDIRPLEGLSFLRKLQGVRFKWRTDMNDDIGFIAQEVEAIYPELVSTNPVSGLKSVKYGNVVAPLVQSVKELDVRCEISERQVASTNERLNKLSDENSALKLKMERLERLVMDLQNSRNK